MSLTDSQIEVYSRQIILREVGGVGQQRLLAARCLVLGTGAACDAATSYLVGAGIGALDLRRESAEPGELRSLAPLESRGSDTRLRPGAMGDEDSAAEHDVVLAFAPEASEVPDAWRDAARAARPRLGTVLVHDAGAGAELLVLPSATSCAACVVRRLAEPLHGRSSARAAILGVVGALAALACCRFVLGLGDVAPRALWLKWDGAASTERVPRLAPRCPRGCPPRGESV